MTTEMKTITIELPADLAFGSKVDGTFVPVDVSKLHATWVTEMLRYGVQRKLNDHVAGQGKEKLELARAFAVELQKGEEKPARMAGGGSAVAPEITMARGVARKLLHSALSKLTGESKLGDIVAYGEKPANAEAGETIAKYLTVNANGLPVWNTGAIDKWMEGKPGGRDLVAEAKASLAVVDDIQL